MMMRRRRKRRMCCDTHDFSCGHCPFSWVQWLRVPVCEGSSRVNMVLGNPRWLIVSNRVIRCVTKLPVTSSELFYGQYCIKSVKLSCSQ
jgi:hypothetical protein